MSQKTVDLDFRGKSNMADHRERQVDYPVNFNDSDDSEHESDDGMAEEEELELDEELRSDHESSESGSEGGSDVERDDGERFGGGDGNGRRRVR